MKKQYYKTDHDGRKLIIEKGHGIVVEILEEPSADYIARMSPPFTEPEPRDYLAEIDELKAKVAQLEKAIKTTK